MTEKTPRRLDAETKAGLLGLVDAAVAEGWTIRAACETLKLSRRRFERWNHRRENLADRALVGGR